MTVLCTKGEFEIFTLSWLFAGVYHSLLTQMWMRMCSQLVL